MESRKLRGGRQNINSIVLKNVIDLCCFPSCPSDFNLTLTLIYRVRVSCFFPVPDFISQSLIVFFVFCFFFPFRELLNHRVQEFCYKMGRMARCCTQSLLKLVNSGLGMAGIGLIVYSLWMLRVWFRHEESVEAPIPW